MKPVELKQALEKAVVRVKARIGQIIGREPLRAVGGLAHSFETELEIVLRETLGEELLRADEALGIINSPETKDFLAGVEREAAHQRSRWSTEHDAGKTPADWFWLLGYLLGKAVHATDPEKRRHHLVTSAGVLMNWHLQELGKTSMRPGIAPPPAVVEREIVSDPGAAVEVTLLELTPEAKATLSAPADAFKKVR